MDEIRQTRKTYDEFAAVHANYAKKTVMHSVPQLKEPSSRDHDIELVKRVAVSHPAARIGWVFVKYNQISDVGPGRSILSDIRGNCIF